MKEFERTAKRIENLFTGTAADQQRKDANVARYPSRSNIHVISNIPEDINFPSTHEKEVLSIIQEDAESADSHHVCL